jgi:hypothetical protein
VRYLRVGGGPPVVLMHTVRTQLDHFWPEPFRQVRWPPRYMMDRDLIEPITQPPSGFLIRVSPP